MPVPGVVHPWNHGAPLTTPPDSGPPASAAACLRSRDQPKARPAVPDSWPTPPDPGWDRPQRDIREYPGSGAGRHRTGGHAHVFPDAEHFEGMADQAYPNISQPIRQKPDSRCCAACAPAQCSVVGRWIWWQETGQRFLELRCVEQCRKLQSQVGLQLRRTQPAFIQKGGPAIDDGHQILQVMAHADIAGATATERLQFGCQKHRGAHEADGAPTRKEVEISCFDRQRQSGAPGDWSSIKPRCLSCTAHPRPGWV
jgi:hypothetical protein